MLGAECRNNNESLALIIINSFTACCCMMHCHIQVVGIITRHDLTHENLSEKWHHKKETVKRQRKLKRRSMNINNNVSISFSRSTDDIDNDSVFTA